MKIIIDADYYTAITYKGTHKGISYNISNHGFNDRTDFYSQRSHWCTYIILNEELHEKYKSKINDAPWNGGQTYYRKHAEEFLDVPPDLKKKWDDHYYKIGDDFSHLRDMERQDWYDKSFMESHIKRVIDFLVGDENENT